MSRPGLSWIVAKTIMAVTSTGVVWGIARNFAGRPAFRSIADSVPFRRLANLTLR